MLVDRESHVAGKTKARKLKLSEAIRIGAAIRPQAFGDFYFEGKSCVMGAAYEAIGNALGPNLWCYPTLTEYFGLDINFLGKLADRNNEGESRESIADSLEKEGL